jgi:hypothetical protein
MLTSLSSRAAPFLIARAFAEACTSFSATSTSAASENGTSACACAAAATRGRLRSRPVISGDGGAGGMDVGGGGVLGGRGSKATGKRGPTAAPASMSCAAAGGTIGSMTVAGKAGTAAALAVALLRATTYPSRIK